jgi:glyoxylate/hydroxypyruvate/2-ketogluconate reductase
MKPKILTTAYTFPEVIEFTRAHFEVEDNQRRELLDAAALRARLQDKEGVLVAGGDRIDEALLQACPRLRAVCNCGVGYNNIDVDACTRRGILATNTPGVLDDTTADLGFTLILSAARRVAEADRYVRSGRWGRWMNDLLLGVDVHHATLGIVGMGRIGRAVARRARGFDMRILYCNRTRAAQEVEHALGATAVGLDELLSSADFVCLTLPYSPAVHHMIGARELALMKPSAVLVNIARGGIVDEDALVAALREHRIGAAGLDVYEGEPAVKPSLLELDNTVLLPHIGSATRATRVAMGLCAAGNLRAALYGETPPNLLNPDALARRAG